MTAHCNNLIYVFMPLLPKIDLSIGRAASSSENIGQGNIWDVSADAAISNNAQPSTARFRFGPLIADSGFDAKQLTSQSTSEARLVPVFAT